MTVKILDELSCVWLVEYLDKEKKYENGYASKFSSGTDGAM